MGSGDGRTGETVTMETVTVVRPLKVIALVFSLISVILLIVGIACPWWLEAPLAENKGGYRQGLWRECTWQDEAESVCQGNEYKAWILASAALCIIAMIVNVGGIVLISLGLCASSPSLKHRYYRIGFFTMLFAAVCLVIALIVFIAKFLGEIKERQQNEWYFEWAFGVAWGAVPFMIGAAILLYLEKESEEIYYHEKYYESES